MEKLLLSFFFFHIYRDLTLFLPEKFNIIIFYLQYALWKGVFSLFNSINSSTFWSDNQADTFGEESFLLEFYF